MCIRMLQLVLVGGKPLIMNNVVVSANSVVIGNITIGDNVKIGAGSVVPKSVPSDCVVVGPPAYIIRKNGEKFSIKL